eukprot:1334817-Amphidinium_carterae.2
MTLLEWLSARAWGHSDVWVSRAVCAIGDTCRAAGPAVSAAFVKLLLGFGLTPKRRRIEGQRFCLWCGELHFTDQLQEYAWLYESPPCALVWVHPHSTFRHLSDCKASGFTISCAG